MTRREGENKHTQKKKGGEEKLNHMDSGGDLALLAKSTKRTSSKQSRYNQNQVLWSPTDHMWTSCMHLKKQLSISQSLELTAVFFFFKIAVRSPV